MKHWVAWLRGINVGAAGKGRKSVPMAELRQLAEGLGWQGPQTYIQSGNLVFAASGTASALQAKLEQAIHDHFDFDVSVVVCALADMKKALAACPYADEAEQRANLVHVGFTTVKLGKSVLVDLEPYCQNGERVTVQGKFLWSDCPNGVGRSKLTPAVLDRAVGASVTMRNVKTLRAIVAMQS
ncbi:MAG: hypothetical protein ACI89X_000304 [Planctomycetota bacterium]|jgi:uncharacterized protein (DUF1697 family)